MAEVDFRGFGWKGISLETPSDWELGKESGTREEGYCRLDNELIPKLEITWKKPDKGYALAKLSDKYIRNLRRRIGRRGAEIERLPGFCKEPAGMECLFIRWGGAVPVYEMIAFCRECYRLTFVRYITEGDSDRVGTARRLFASLADHPEDSRETWAFLGMRFDIAGNFVLRNAVLNAGFIRMDFADRDDEISVAMVSMAREQLETRGPEYTVRRFLARDLKKAPVLQFEPADVNGHDGIAAAAEAGRASRWSMTLFPFRGALRVRAWVCAGTNKFYIVKVRSPRRETLDAISEEAVLVKCH